MTEKRLTFIDFQVINEPWNIFELKDGSIFKVKIILKNIINDGGGFFMNVHNVTAVEPNPVLIGDASPPMKEGEKIESYIEEEDIEIIEKTEIWNEYEAPSENLKLKCCPIPVIISRTKRHDERGIPIYASNIQVIYKPKKLKK